MKRFYVRALTVLYLIIYVTAGSAGNKSEVSNGRVKGPALLKIASFNLQIFGKTKLGRPYTLSVLADIASKFDIIALQEVGSNRSSASDETCMEIMDVYVAKINEIAGEKIYSYISGNQYAVVYRTDRVRIRDYLLYNGSEVFAYTPLIVNIETVEDGSSLDFSLINIHTSPELAVSEIPALKGVITQTGNLFDESDVICLGDFNADGDYYDEGEHDWLRGFIPGEYITVIPNSYDTTSSDTEYTYDRIQMTSALAEDYTGKSGVFRFDRYYDLTGCEGTINTAGTVKAVSDHYPVWCMLYTDRDND